MSQLTQIMSAQKTLEESFLKKMGDLEAQIQNAGPSKDTVAKVAEEFRTFRELIFGMLGLLRQQILECSKQVDALETRHRRKALVIQGLVEADNEDSRAVVIDVLRNKMACNDLTPACISVCHRLGSLNKEHHRPMLVRFVSLDSKGAVWKAKTKLKGSPISIKEFLTKPRQTIFLRARQHFGMKSCWTQDGVISIKTPDGKRHKITTAEELTSLVAKYPCRT